MPIIRNPFRRPDETLRSSDEKADTPRYIDTKGPTEYKLSEIDDSGAYLPPSPLERDKTFWSNRSNGSTTSSNHRSVLAQDEPFNISRESFDSYRRSFDICARSPVIPPEARPRVSLDSHSRLTPQTRHSATFQKPEPTREEDFEDVGLNDDASRPKKRGFFSRFGDSNEQTNDGRPASGNNGHHHNFLGGRRRGHSGAGQELGDINRSDGQ